MAIILAIFHSPLFMYLVGVLPALIAFWVRRNIPESPRWQESNNRRSAAHKLQRQGAALHGILLLCSHQGSCWTGVLLEGA
jgi:hypothetical protein